MHDTLYLLGDVARMLNVQPHRIVYLFTSQKLAEVPMLGKRRVFGLDDVRRVAKELGLDWDSDEEQQEVAT